MWINICFWKQKFIVSEWRCFYRIYRCESRFSINGVDSGVQGNRNLPKYWNYYYYTYTYILNIRTPHFWLRHWLQCLSRQLLKSFSSKVMNNKLGCFFTTSETTKIIEWNDWINPHKLFRKMRRRNAIFIPLFEPNGVSSDMSFES